MLVLDGGGVCHSQDSDRSGLHELSPCYSGESLDAHTLGPRVSPQPLHSVFPLIGLVIPHILQVAVLWGWFTLLFLLLLVFFLLVPRELRGLGSQLIFVCSQALGPLELAAHQWDRAGQPSWDPPSCTR